MRQSVFRTAVFYATMIWRAAVLQKGLRRRLGVVAALASGLVAAHPAGAAVGRGVDHAFSPTTIRVAPTGWGSTRVEDLQVVLDAVATEFGSRFPGRTLGTIQVVPGAGPLVLYERGQEGAYIVELSARNERWYQFVYQFSHELCHIYSNFDNKDGGREARGNQWFEESVCEAAALFTLRKLAASWTSTPPDEKWSPHATALHSYAEHFLNEPHRRLPPTRSFTAWFQKHQTALLANPYFRDKNEVVSNLLLPLFEHDPRNWGAIGYLNHDREHSRKSFSEFLRAWYEACPDEYRDVVREIIALFGGAATHTAVVTPALSAP